MRAIDYFDKTADLYPERVAITDGDRRFSYADTHRFSERIAQGMRAAGAKIEDRAAIYSHNDAAVLFCMLGILRAGAAWVPINFRTATDANNAHACGLAAVKAAVEGRSGFMVKIVRGGSTGAVQWSTSLQPLGDIANVEHLIPRDWISEDGLLPNEKFVEYARPLVEGEVKFPLEGGLPRYVALEKSMIERKLPPRA